MDPKDFSWTEDQTITVVNPTDQNFPFKVHNKDYVVGAGQTAKMPGYIAWLYVYGLASKLCQDNREFNRWNEEGFRNTYYDKLVIGADDVVQQVILEPKVEDATDLGANELDTSETPTSMKSGAKRGRPAQS